VDLDYPAEKPMSTFKRFRSEWESKVSVKEEGAQVVKTLLSMWRGEEKVCQL